MRYVYTVNGIGLDIVFFASKRATLNYARAHNIRKLQNGKWGIVRVWNQTADAVRNDFMERKSITY